MSHGFPVESQQTIPLPQELSESSAGDRKVCGHWSRGRQVVWAGQEGAWESMEEGSKAAVRQSSRRKAMLKGAEALVNLATAGDLFSV